jgi:hypothetical protein
MKPPPQITALSTMGDAIVADVWNERMTTQPDNDSRSIESIVAALYETISGPAGAPRGWDRLRALFFPGARLLRTMVAPDGAVSLAAMSIEDFIVMAEPHFRSSSFYEREVFRRVDQFSHVAQVFSTYEASTAPEGGDLLGRGINSVQLWFDGKRWWVTSLLWDDERPGNPIPHEYLP